MSEEDAPENLPNLTLAAGGACGEEKKTLALLRFYLSVRSRSPSY